MIKAKVSFSLQIPLCRLYFTSLHSPSARLSLCHQLLSFCLFICFLLALKSSSCLLYDENHMTAAKASQIICYSLITASEAFMPTVVCVCSRRILANFSPFQDSFTPPRCILCCVLGAFRFQEVRLSRRMRMRRRRRRKGLWSLSRVIRTRMYVLCMLWRPKAVQVILFSLGKACDTWCFYLIGRVFGLLVCLFSCLTQNSCRWPQNFPGAGCFDRRVWCWFCCF